MTRAKKKPGLRTQDVMGALIDFRWADMSARAALSSAENHRLLTLKRWMEQPGGVTAAQRRADAERQDRNYTEILGPHCDKLEQVRADLETAVLRDCDDPDILDEWREWDANARATIGSMREKVAEILEVAGGKVPALDRKFRHEVRDRKATVEQAARERL